MLDLDVCCPSQLLQVREERTPLIATLNRDLPAIERLWSEDLTVNAPNNRVVVGRRAVLDTFVHAGIINFSVFERRIEHIRADAPSSSSWDSRR